MSWKLFVQHFTAATQSVIAGIATAGLAPVCLATTDSACTGSMIIFRN